MKQNLLIATIGLLICSCTTTKELYDWKGYDDAVYSYTRNRDEKSLENIVNVYNKLISNRVGSRNMPPPGICADYGYILIENGNLEKGKELLIKETELYPESKIFIDRILKRFEN